MSKLEAYEQVAQTLFAQNEALKLQVRCRDKAIKELREQLEEYKEKLRQFIDLPETNSIPARTDQPEVRGWYTNTLQPTETT